ncbi:solute carrier family 2 member 11, like [Xenentodon cancila]
MSAPALSQHLSLLLNCPVVIAVIFVSGFGGTFQYGFSLSVMASPSAFIKQLVNQTCLERYNLSLEEWQVSVIWSCTMSIFCIGGFVGSLVVSSLTTRLGRKRCLLFNNFLAIFGAILMVLSQTARSFEMIMVGRLIYGINAGVGLSAHTRYLIECAPTKLRGMVGVSLATFVAFGKFSGQLLGIRELLGTEKNWHWLLGFNGFTALFQLLTLPFLPESPSFLLVERGDRKASETALKRLWGDKDYSKVVEEMLREKAALQSVRDHSVLELFQNPTVRWQLLTVIAAFISLQFCGINAVYFYCFDVFRAAGIDENKLPYAALGTGLCELLFSVVCFMMIESIGKIALLISGCIGMSTAMILLIVTLFLQNHVSWMPYCSMVLVFIFIFFFSCGPAATVVPLPGEILTQSFKSAGYAVGCTINWAGLFLLGMLFPILAENMGNFCFVIFPVVCLICALHMKLNVPETKNRTALEITAEFERMHSKASQKKQAAEGELGVIIHETEL